MSFLQVKNVGKSYGQVKVLKDISIDIEKGEFICLLGPSGCGKSTLLRIIAGLEDKHDGKIIINDKDMTNSPPESRNFGIVFQSYALFPNMNVYKNIAFGLENKNISKSDIDKKVRDILEVVELSGYDKKYPSQLSGGQQQRVALDRAIALEPDFLLLDEPLLH
ncbi:ABC transporter ATP-binding protein [Clostridioides difficile]